MDIACATSGRHFSSVDAFNDCHKSCEDGRTCPYLKMSINLNKSTNTITAKPAIDIFDKALIDMQTQPKQPKTQIYFKPTSYILNEMHNRFKNIGKYKFFKR